MAVTEIVTFAQLEPWIVQLLSRFVSGCSC